MVQSRSGKGDYLTIPFTYENIACFCNRNKGLGWCLPFCTREFHAVVGIYVAFGNFSQSSFNQAFLKAR
ncbi:MAG: hypothetical protein JWQ14_1652 [Adhaeribacter sp.]|nr:hypothetical protein [Adhaeribacter sp.]